MPFEWLQVTYFNNRKFLLCIVYLFTVRAYWMALVLYIILSFSGRNIILTLAFLSPFTSHSQRLTLFPAPSSFRNISLNEQSCRCESLTAMSLLCSDLKQFSVFPHLQWTLSIWEGFTSRFFLLPLPPFQQFFPSSQPPTTGLSPTTAVYRAQARLC